jgi:Spy/CpxP family protein refolding chaperone
MKQILCAVIAAAILAAGPFAGRARADEGGEDRGHRSEQFEKRMKERLGLSDDQAAKLKAAWKAEKETMKSLREQSKETARKLESEVRDLASEKDIQATLDQLDANRKSMAAERQKLEATTASILKPSQRAKMRLLLARRMKRGAHWKRRSGGASRGEDREKDETRRHGDDE